jgi:hypothetical protein
MIAINKLAIVILGIALSMLACSPQWTASVKVRWADSSHRSPLTVQFTDSFGEQFNGKLINDCIEVHIGQHSKLPNKIKISILNEDGKLITSGFTHDLAKQEITLPLNGLKESFVIVTPSGKCIDPI